MIFKGMLAMATVLIMFDSVGFYMVCARSLRDRVVWGMQPAESLFVGVVK